MVKDNYNEYQKEYKKKHLVLLVVNLNKDKDKDIIQALEQGNSRAGEAKRLIRIGMGKI